MGNAGEARLDVVAMGRDEVTVMMNKISGELDALKGKLAGYEKAQRGTVEAAKSGADAFKTQAAGAFDAGEKVAEFAEKAGGSMKSAVGPLDKVRGGFELLRSNAGFLAGGIGVVVSVVTGAVSAFLEFANGADKGAAATRQWEKDLKGFNAAIEKAWEALDRTTKTDVEKALVDVNTELFKAKLTLADISRGSQEWWDKTRQLRNMEEARAALYADMARDAQATRDAIAAMVAPMYELSRVPLPKLFQGTSKDADLTLLRNPVTGEVETDAMRAAREKSLADAIKRTRPRGGGGGRKPKDPYTFSQDRLLSDYADFEMLRNSGRGQEWVPGPGDILTPESNDAIAPMTNQLSEMAQATEDAAAAFTLLGKATGDLDTKLPGISGAFSAISEIWKKTNDSAESLAGGVIGSVDAIATAGAAWLKDEKTRTRFLGLKNILLSAPMAFVDPAQAAAMFGTGVGLLALAGGGGGGGGGGRGGGSSGSSSGGGGSSGPSTIVQQVNQYPIMFGDRQTIVTATREGERSARGTGASSRRGA